MTVTEFERCFSLKDRTDGVIWSYPYHMFVIEFNNSIFTVMDEGYNRSEFSFVCLISDIGELGFL